jgi:hypothetical protein
MDNNNILLLFVVEDGHLLGCCALQPGRGASALSPGTLIIEAVST